MYLSQKKTSGRRGWVGSAELALRRTEIKRKTKETKEDMYYVSVRVLHADLIRVHIQHKRDRDSKDQRKIPTMVDLPIS